MTRSNWSKTALYLAKYLSLHIRFFLRFLPKIEQFTGSFLLFSIAWQATRHSWKWIQIFFLLQISHFLIVVWYILVLGNRIFQSGLNFVILICQVVDLKMCNMRPIACQVMEKSKNDPMNCLIFGKDLKKKWMCKDKYLAKYNAVFYQSLHIPFFLRFLPKIEPFTGLFLLFSIAWQVTRHS